MSKSEVKKVTFLGIFLKPFQRIWNQHEYLRFLYANAHKTGSKYQKTFFYKHIFEFTN